MPTTTVCYTVDVQNNKALLTVCFQGKCQNSYFFDPLPLVEFLHFDFYKRHKRLPEESDLVSISSDSEKQKLPIDFTDPTDSDGSYA